MSRLTRPRHSHFRSDGAPKESFTEVEARAKAADLLSDDMDNGRLLSCPVAYRCGECEAWHVGNCNPRGPWSSRPIDEIRAEIATKPQVTSP